MLAQLPAEVLIIDAAVYTADIQKHLVDAVLLHARRQLLEMRHNPVRQRCIELVIARERDDRLRELRRLQLEPGDAHFNTQPFRFGTARDDATIVISEWR